MIIGLGIDSVEIERFKQWNSFSKQKLLRIFSEQEISYCLQSKAKIAERFAAHFATREAFFKAIQTAYPTIYMPFLSVCRTISISTAHNGSPILIINEDMLRQISNNAINKPLSSLITITHTRTTATACILLQS